jgi:hypothetical protein
MMSRIPFPVVATHDISNGQAPPIKMGTAGDITGISGATPSHYTVAFHPFGPGGVVITLNYLTRTDLREA